MSKEEFEVSNVFACAGKLRISVVSLDNDQVINAIASLVEEVKYRGIKVPTLEDIKKQAIADATPPPAKIVLDDAEMALVETGRQIQAIKAVRARHSGLGLKDAKDACDAYKVEWERKTGKRW